MSRHFSSTALLAGQCATVFAGACLNAACGSSTAGTPTGTETGTISTEAPAFYKNFGNGVSVTVEGNSVVISSKNLPDHESPYYGTGNVNYEAYNGTNARFSLNSNRIA